ncbi:MAG TPA: ATP-dependent helicase HrpB [Devosiaceae bacterium]|nr:ATP-dependent helicase HrpB [Devosiaceae bacterium]
MTIPATPLPIDAVLPSLLAALEAGPFAVLVAAPGAGKTTRVPLVLLNAGWRADGRIIMLEPRRLAARAAARRMAATLGEEVGATVGYRVRLDARISKATRIEVVTEGVFSRMILDDPGLSGIAAVIFDEFHERNLEGDLGLALALDATALRPDLRLLVMSATIDAIGVARLLADAPVIASEGRAFPVETRHLPPAAGERLEDSVAAAVLRALDDEGGSILAFLPGQAEIRRTEERLRDRVSATVDLAPLYGQLTSVEQDRAIDPAPPGRRKVVLATSIAQTSLTIEGVRIVVDGGFSRVPAYEPATGLTMLETRRVSRAAAEQRRGRAGRTEPGVCYRLWAEPQDASLLPFDRPEILEADLAGLALDLANWGIGDPAALAFLDPPPAAAWNEAVTLLKELEAIDASGRITDEGRALADLPLHPRLAHMIHRARLEADALTAAEAAVLVTERGLGGSDVDLDERLRRFRQERGPRADEARSLARRWAGGSGRGGSGTQLGRHLARAFPDRVAQASGRPGRFRLANGRAASVDETDALARAPFLVVTDVTGNAANGRIRAAAPIDREEIEEIFGGHIVEETSLTFDRPSRSVRARRVRRLGEVRLADAPVSVSDAEAAADLLAGGIAEIGIAALPWSKEQSALRARATYLQSVLGNPWPDLSDVSLAATVGNWLAPYLIGRTAVAEISADELGQALAELLPWNLRAEMENLLPSHFDAPSGNRHPIDYGGENGPTLSIRVQELFGLDRHPSVAGGKVPLLLVLLSPAHRPIQTTQDLPGFWRGSWKDVAKDLKGRYPRHFWPDDAVSAAATARAKPRGT